MKKYDANETSIREILAIPEFKYSIPRNQRDYVWEERHWKEFLNDVNFCIQEISWKYEIDEYFIWSCVIKKDDKKKEYSIIDGQQRITTILIILSVLRDIFEEKKEKELADWIKSYLSKKNDDGIEYLILVNENLGLYFRNFILRKEKVSYLPDNEQQKRIEKAYNYFYKEITVLCDWKDDLSFLKILRDQILELKIIRINVINEIDWYTIFEILNAKGKQLELSDRMKNIFLKALPKTFPDDDAKIQWERIRKNIQEASKWKNSFSNFINHYWISNYKKRTEDEIYYHFKSEIASQETIKDFIDDLEKNSEFYKRITLTWEFSKEENMINMILRSFKLYPRLAQVRPILLSLFSNYENWTINEKNLIKYLKRLESFHFIFSWVTSSLWNKIEKIYYKHSPIIKNNYSPKNIKDFFDELKEELPDYESFKLWFKRIWFSNKNKEFKSKRNLVRYILEKIDNYYFNNTWEYKADSFSIEHILWDNGTLWTAQIWNLLPLAQKFNWKSEDFILKSKLSNYKNSNYISVKKFYENNKEKELWTKEDIEKRTEELSKIAYNEIWKF